MENFSPSRKLVIGSALALYIGIIGYKLLSKTPDEIHEGLLEKRRESVEASIKQLSILDPNFLACIKKTAKKYASISPKSSGGIDKAHDLKILYCRQQNIQSLSGIEQLDQLIFLNVSNNRIESIDPLRANTQLKTLHLSGNPLSDIAALKDHTLLESLTLPKLPNIDCNSIKTTLKNAKKLRLPPCKQSQSRTLVIADRNIQNTRETIERESRELSDKEERELLDYEYELLRKID